MQHLDNIGLDDQPCTQCVGTTVFEIIDEGSADLFRSLPIFPTPRLDERAGSVLLGLRQESKSEPGLRGWIS